MQKLLSTPKIFQFDHFAITPLFNITPIKDQPSKFKKSYCFGTIVTPKTIGSCILLEDGSVLTSLHVIFDLKKHKSIYDVPPENQPPIKDFYAPPEGMELYFVKNNCVYLVKVTEVIKDGRPHLYHQRVDSKFGWDYALLKPSADLLEVLGPGMELDKTDYTHGRRLMTENPSNTFFISRPNIDWVNFEFSQYLVKGSPRLLQTGPLSLYGDDPTPSFTSFSGGAVINGQGKLYQIKNQAEYSLYTNDIARFMAETPQDTQILPYYYQFGIKDVLFIGKKETKKRPVDKAVYHSVPFLALKNAIGNLNSTHELCDTDWGLTNDDRTIKVWEISKTEKWDFHFSAVMDTTGSNMTKFHFTLRDREEGKSRSAFYWYTLIGHNKEATLSTQSIAGESIELSELDDITCVHVMTINTYSETLFLKIIEFVK